MARGPSKQSPSPSSLSNRREPSCRESIADRKRKMLVAMATGTGKTFTLVNQVYRLMKSGVGERILFLVDRRALAATSAIAAIRPANYLPYPNSRKLSAALKHSSKPPTRSMRGTAKQKGTSTSSRSPSLPKPFAANSSPQDPNDEPASVLLERIRQQQNGMPIKKAKPTRKKARK